VLVVERVVVELLEVPLRFLFWSTCGFDDGVWGVELSVFVVVVD
jgi:hypothetical protein